MKSINKYTKDDQSVEKVIRVLFYLSVFLAPTNLFKVWRPSWSYLGGSFVDYWAPKLYVSQLTTWCLAVVFLSSLVFTAVKTQKQADLTRLGARVKVFFRQKAKWSSHWGIFIVIFLTFLSILLSTSPWRSATWVFLFFSGPVLWLAITVKAKLLPHLSQALVLSSLFQASIALYQAVFQRSVFGYLFLGEPQFRPLLGLAASQFSSSVRALPYGTTAHPNLLAAWLCLGLLSLWQIWRNRKYRFSWPMSISFLVLLSALIATESISAWLSLGIIGIFLWKKPTVLRVREGISRSKHRTTIVLILFILLQAAWLGALTASCTLPKHCSDSWQRRLTLSQASLTDQSLLVLGTGLNQGISQLETRVRPQIGGRFLQPVHNSFLFLLSDIGIWTFLLLIIFSVKEYFNYSYILFVIFSFIPIFTLDHYTLSIISGQWILIIMIIFINFEFEN